MESNVEKEVEKPEEASGNNEEDQFEISGVQEINEKLENVAIDDHEEEKDKKPATKLNMNSKVFVKPAAKTTKLVKSDRVFKPKNVENNKKITLENKGKERYL